MIGIAVAVGGLTAINVTVGTLHAAFAYTVSRTPVAQISVTVQACDLSVVPMLQSIPNVDGVQIETSFLTRWRVHAPRGHVSIAITGFSDFSDVQLFPFRLTAGRLPGVGEIAMESSDRALHPVELGDTVTLTTARGPVGLRVVGFSRTPGRVSAGFTSFASGYMSAAGIAAAAGIEHPNDIEISVHDVSRARMTVQAVTARLRELGLVVLDTSLMPDSFEASPADGLIAVMNVLSGVALLLSALLIINTVTTLVREQVPVIGVMKALGATHFRIVRGYMTSVLIYGLAGTALGIPSGLVCSYQVASYLAELATLDIGPLAVDVRTMAVALLVGLGTPLAAAAAPLWFSTRITVREAISAHGTTAVTPRSNSQPGSLGLIPVTVGLGIRSVIRRRLRAALTLLALTCAALSFLAIQTTTHSVNVYLDRLYTQYGGDLFVSTARPAPSGQVRDRLLAVPNVSSVEHLESSYVQTRWGPMLLIGVEDRPALYKREVVAGRWFQPGQERTVLINEQMANRSGLKVGDRIAITSATKTERWTVTGEVHDLNGGLGVAGIALTPISQLWAFEDRPQGIANGFIVGAADRSAAAVGRTASRVDEDLTQIGLAPYVTTTQQNLQRNQNQFQVLYILLRAATAIVALVGVLGLFNTLTTSVLERRREIGILRCLGATGPHVATVFWSEGMALACAAWAVAVVLGIPAAYGFVALISAVLINIPFAFDPTSPVVMLVFMLAIASLGSVIPARAAAQIRVVDTLRYE